MAARRGPPALPSAPARCGRLARLWGTMLPPSLPRHLRPPALRLARAQCGAIREAAPPLCPPLCPGLLALSCPLSARPLSPCPAPCPWLQGLRPPISQSASSLFPFGVHRAEQCARQPSHPLSPLLPPGVLSSWFVARTLYRTQYLRGQAAQRPRHVQGPRLPQAVSSVAGHPLRSCPWSAHTSRA